MTQFYCFVAILSLSLGVLMLHIINWELTTFKLKNKEKKIVKNCNFTHQIEF